MCRPAFYPRSVHVRFVVDKAAIGQGFLRVLWFSPVTLTPPMLHAHLYLCFSYQKDERAKPGNLQKRKVLLEIGEHRIEKSFYLVLKV
jgi:hypothetical protein